MKKRIIGIVFAIALVLSIGAVAYAATGGFTMTYLPGTSDTVTNMPPADSGTGGEVYTVSSTVPQREGYEFIDWTLDYGVVNTYTLTYQVTGDPTYGIPGDTATPDPVTGIREGSSVTLAGALTTAWETENGSAPESMSSYVVNFWENETDIVLCDPMVFDNQLVGSIVRGLPLDIDGYKCVGTLNGDTITIQPSQIGKWTFTGWCSDEACTTPITEVTNISADTTVYGKWVYSETENNNEITFYYEKMPVVQYTSYTVRYVDRTTGADIAAPNTVDNQKVGDTVIETAVESDNYDLDDDDIKSLPLQAENNEIIFYYKPAIANFIVLYVDVSYGEPVNIIEPVFGTGNVGSKITQKYIDFPDYLFIGARTRISKTLTRNDDDNVFIFEYVRPN